MTDISGSSNYVEINFVTYANDAKVKFLGVSSETLENLGAVSEKCAVEMAQGVLKNNLKLI
ncbi:MAG: CinA family protein [Candidatus Melainabacteria bacterium]|nr:MAG: CinA family protein [Candidatus Melainabacteria bacterium]